LKVTLALISSVWTARVPVRWSAANVTQPPTGWADDCFRMKAFGGGIGTGRAAHAFRARNQWRSTMAEDSDNKTVIVERGGGGGGTAVLVVLLIVLLVALFFIFGGTSMFNSGDGTKDIKATVDINTPGN
jgi:hypothetical protein